jgi:hypothetical protein
MSSDSETEDVIVQNPLEDALKCAICVETFYKPVTLLCQHSFCSKCLKKMEARKCPMCKVGFVIPAEYNRSMDQIIEHLFPLEYEEKKKEEENEKYEVDEREKIKDKLHKELYNQILDARLDDFYHTPSPPPEPPRTNLIDYSVEEVAQFLYQTTIKCMWVIMGMCIWGWGLDYYYSYEYERSRAITLAQSACYSILFVFIGLYQHMLKYVVSRNVFGFGKIFGSRPIYNLPTMPRPPMFMRGNMRPQHFEEFFDVPFQAVNQFRNIIA